MKNLAKVMLVFNLLLFGVGGFQQTVHHTESLQLAGQTIHQAEDLPYKH